MMYVYSRSFAGRSGLILIDVWQTDIIILPDLDFVLTGLKHDGLLQVVGIYASISEGHVIIWVLSLLNMDILDSR